MNNQDEDDENGVVKNLFVLSCDSIGTNKCYLSGSPEDEPCPNCGKTHVVACKDKKHRCAKCGWCIEDKAKDFEFLS